MAPTYAALAWKRIGAESEPSVRFFSDRNDEDRPWNTARSDEQGGSVSTISFGAWAIGGGDWGKADDASRCARCTRRSISA